MARERISIDLPDVAGFKPRESAQPPIDIAEIKQVAERAGFQTRHVPVAISNSGFDARSLRRTIRTAKLNIATSTETRERFWRMAQAMGLTVGEEVLIALMNAYECKHRKERP